MRILLAPMEGVVDHTMRTMLSEQGGLDRCVTEFIRVTTTTLPARVFYRYCPELLSNSRTPSGTPVYVQLLGGNPEPMAINAARAASLGAAGIDINFGCPAKLVNRNDGGSVLLKEPQRLLDIVSAVRTAVPTSTPVTVKIRLGFEDRGLLMENCQAIFAAGADELTIHARTKTDGYKPPAYWEAIAAIKANSPIPVIANGEIWSVEDYRNCIQRSDCDDIMLGRGLLSNPGLAREIKTLQLASSEQPTNCTAAMDWPQVITLLERFCLVTEECYERKYVANRIKQWLGYLRQHYSEAQILFDVIKRLKWPEDIAMQLQQHKSNWYAERAA